jgi:hypothetical protein
MVTRGPDTPRGGLNRVKQVSCSLDAATEAGDFKVDGEEYEFKFEINDDCWGADFAQMAAEQLPDLVNADGFVEVEMTVTGYTDIPSSWSADTSAWDVAYDIYFGFSEDEITNYKMLMQSDDNGVAASIYEKELAKDEGAVFAMSILKTDGEDDEHEFRYEGRFAFGQFGDDSYGSRHVRVIARGPYAGDGGFESITAASGFEAGMYGNDSGALQSGQISTFVATSAGIGALDFNVDLAGVTDGSSSESGVNGINDYAYTGTAEQKKSFLTTDVAAYTDAAAWHKANGPLDFESAIISD